MVTTGVNIDFGGFLFQCIKKRDEKFEHIILVCVTYVGNDEGNSEIKDPHTL